MPEQTQPPAERPQEPAPAEKTPAGEIPEQATRRAADILAKALSEAESLLLSAVPSQAAPPETGPGAAPPSRGPSFEEISGLIHDLIEHFDRALDRLAEDRRTLIDEVQSAWRALKEYFERAQDRMDDDRRYLSERIAALSQANERLEKRLEEIAAALAEVKSRPATPEWAPEVPPPAEVREPQFMPGEVPLTLIVSAVPGFQGLMEAQRALMRLPAIGGASVERYFDGEARIVLTLKEPVTAGELVETLSQATGQQAEIEESRPEALRLRVRFSAAPS